MERECSRCHRPADYILVTTLNLPTGQSNISVVTCHECSRVLKDKDLDDLRQLIQAAGGPDLVHRWFNVDDPEAQRFLEGVKCN